MSQFSRIYLASALVALAALLATAAEMPAEQPGASPDVEKTLARIDAELVQARPVADQATPADSATVSPECLESVLTRLDTAIDKLSPVARQADAASALTGPAVSLESRMAALASELEAVQAVGADISFVPGAPVAALTMDIPTPLPGAGFATMTAPARIPAQPRFALIPSVTPLTVLTQASDATPRRAP